MFQLTPGHTDRPDDRSTIDLKVRGDAEIRGNKIPAFVSLELPNTLSAAVSHMVTRRRQLLGDFTWMGWSNVPALSIQSRATRSVPSHEPLGFKDTYRVGVGTQYQYSDTLPL